MRVAVPYIWHISRISNTCQTPVGTKPLTSGRGAGTSGEACSILSDQCSRAVLLKFYCAHKSLEVLLKCDFHFLGLGWGLRVGSANKLPGDAAVAGPGLCSEEPGKVVGSPATSVISQGFRSACRTPRASRLPSLSATPLPSLLEFSSSTPGNSPVVPSGTALPAGVEHRPHTRPG